MCPSFWDHIANWRSRLFPRTAVAIQHSASFTTTCCIGLFVPDFLQQKWVKVILAKITSDSIISGFEQTALLIAKFWLQLARECSRFSRAGKRQRLKKLTKAKWVQKKRVFDLQTETTTYRGWFTAKYVVTNASLIDDYNKRLHHTTTSDVHLNVLLPFFCVHTLNSAWLIKLKHFSEQITCDYYQLHAYQVCCANNGNKPQKQWLFFYLEYTFTTP